MIPAVLHAWACCISAMIPTMIAMLIWGRTKL